MRIALVAICLAVISCGGVRHAAYVCENHGGNPVMVPAALPKDGRMLVEIVCNDGTLGIGYINVSRDAG
jgi:hypothetical protein